MMFGLFALATAAIFFGAAFYVNFAEQSARLNLDDRSLLVEWKPAYKRGFIMQASLAVIGFVLGILAWWQTGVWLWLVGALVLVANWPYTLLVIMPTNNTLMATDPAQASLETRQLIRKWGSLRRPLHYLGAALVSIGGGEDCAAGAAGDSTNVSQRFQPSGRALLSNSP
jgi:uncharacterized membrane protein